MSKDTLYNMFIPMTDRNGYQNGTSTEHLSSVYKECKRWNGYRIYFSSMDTYSWQLENLKMIEFNPFDTFRSDEKYIKAKIFFKTLFLGYVGWHDELSSY